MKLSRRLSLFFLAVIAVGAGSTLFLVSLSTGKLFRSFVYSGDADKAEIYATILGDFYSENRSWAEAQPFLAEIPGLLFTTLDQRIHGEHGSVPAPAFPPDAINALNSDRIVVADLQGIIVADTSGDLLRTFHPPKHLIHGVTILSGNERTGTVLVGSMIDSSLGGINEQFLKSIMKSLLWATGFSACIAFLLGLLFTTRVSQPLAALTRAARRVATGDLGALVPVVGSDELSDLSASFNAMTGELKRLEEAKKQIIADSAHELRTPVTLIQGTIEAMIDGIYPLDVPTLEGLHEETLRLSHLIDMLRELEVIESGRLQLALEEIDAGTVVQKAVSLFMSAAAEKNIELSVITGDAVPLLMKADRLRMDQVVYNILSNAIKYTPPMGQVRVGAGRGSTSDEIILRIEDSGPGIPEYERERIFERFYRIDKARTSERGGRGLGLAIAGEIVKAHGGSISVEDSALGGAAFLVRMGVRSNSSFRDLMAAMDAVQSQVLEKVKKLLALATSPSEAEAAAALAKASILLAKYGLSMAEVHQEQDVREDVLMEKKRLRAWESALVTYGLQGRVYRSPPLPYPGGWPHPADRAGGEHSHRKRTLWLPAPGDPDSGANPRL